MTDIVLQFLYRVLIWFVYRTFQVSSEKISPPPPEGGENYKYKYKFTNTWKVRYTNQNRIWYRNWRTTTATQLQPSKSLCYIGYTSAWWQHDCWLTVQTPYAIYILTPERISQGHVQNRRRATFSWPILYKPAEPYLISFGHQVIWGCNLETHLSNLSVLAVYVFFFIYAVRIIDGIVLCFGPRLSTLNSLLFRHLRHLSYSTLCSICS